MALAATAGLTGCITAVHERALLVRSSWGELFRFETDGFGNADGHRLAPDECYVFLSEQAADGRLLLRSIEPISEDAGQGNASVDENPSRN